MFTLLNPAALLALLGLLVPLAIHLWNRRPGREVAVGSLRWLAAGANRRLRNLKLEQLWLLLLRAALLAVLALALADPVRRQLLPASRGQVLLSPAVVGSPAFATLRPAIDSLRRQGYVLRWLTKGFPRLSGAVWQADSVVMRDSARALLTANQTSAGRQWARVQQAAGLFAGQPLYVVTPSALRGFQGAHVPLPATVMWQVLPTGTAKTWLQAATVHHDSLHLLVGQGNERRTAFRWQSVPERKGPGEQVRVAGLPPLHYVPNVDGSENMVLSPAAANPQKELDLGTGIDAVPMIIDIYATPEYAQDARYLQAALRAASVGLMIPPVLRRLTARPSTLVTNGWNFWLSEEPLPADWRKQVQQGAHVWQEAAGPGQADRSSLLFDENQGPVALFRRGAAKADSATALTRVELWGDAQGRSVLSRHSLGTGALYQLHTRLNPAWSELAESSALPAQLLRLLQPELTDTDAPAATDLDKALAAYDQRSLDPAQLQPGSAEADKNAAVITASLVPPAFRQTDLRPWLVLLAGLLFLLERLLARRRDSLPLPSAP